MQFLRDTPAEGHGVSRRNCMINVRVGQRG